MTTDGAEGFDEFLASVDRDGALAETRALAVASVSRRRLLGFALAGAGTALVSGAAKAEAAGGLVASDIAILNYALVLEYLQASFYTEAERSGALTGKTAAAAKVVGAVERAHVAAFRQLLASKAVKRPLFNFAGTTEQQQPFLKTAVAFEDLAVAAYKGQAPLLKSKAVLASAIGIHSVEARHAAWMRELFGITPAVHAFDQPPSKQKITEVVASTHFIVASPRVKRSRKPKYTG
ncbi:MAG: ferritin-like domain-containing protein [Gaiellaceae bacterium]